MKKSKIIIILIGITIYSNAQNKTDISLFLKNDSAQYLSEISSETGDLFSKLGHHGPAIENEWLAFRMYFDQRVAIDIYSKQTPGLELKQGKWYPSVSQQKNGWGADYYKVGTTVGCGGVRLWDGESVVPLNPVSERYAKVVKEGTISYMEILSKDVPYKNRKVDVLVRVTVYSGLREAKVEAFALTDEPVQFVTGLNYHKGQTTIKTEKCIIAWGFHPEDVAAEKVELGAAIIFDPDDFVKRIDDGQQILLISKPTKNLECWISSANAQEAELNSLKKFKNYVVK